MFCKRRNFSLVFLSYSQRRSLSPKHTSSTSNFFLSLSLSFSLLIYKYIYIHRRTTKTTTRPNPLLMRAARIHVARGAPLTALCVMLRLKERKRGTRNKVGSHITQKIEREREREKRKKSLPRLSLSNATH